MRKSARTICSARWVAYEPAVTSQLLGVRWIIAAIGRYLCGLQGDAVKVIIAEPPNVAEIDKVFPLRGTGIIYAFGDKIYNPAGAKIPPFLFAHEGAHGDRQISIFGIDRWWRQYLDDADFRYHEEVIGHAAEFLSLSQGEYDRNRKARLMLGTAARLLAPFYAYGGKFSHKKAVHDLTHAAHRMSK